MIRTSRPFVPINTCLYRVAPRLLAFGTLASVPPLRRPQPTTMSSRAAPTASASCSPGLNADHNLHVDNVARVVPALDNAKYKGQAGRVGVFGGSPDYSGAPYFAAMAALKTGADLVHVYCHPDAAGPIKTYSPELIVHPALVPGLTKVEMLSLAAEWCERLDTIVVGPGIGRDSPWVETLVQCGLRSQTPVIMDADTLFLLSQDPSMLDQDHSLDQIFLTCNGIELKRLAQALQHDLSLSSQDQSQNISRSLKATVVAKGQVDHVVGHGSAACATPGSTRRCGGQGDILAGILGTFSAWAHVLDPESHAAGSSYVMDMSFFSLTDYHSDLTANAFDKNKRSTTAGDVLSELPAVFESVYPAVPKRTR